MLNHVLNKKSDPCHPLPKDFFFSEENKKTMCFKKGDTVYSMHSEITGLFCIKSGKVKITHLNSKGKETLIQILQEGDILGLHHLFTHSKYTTSAIALVDSQICFVEKHFISSALKEDAQLAFQIIHKLSVEIDETQNRLLAQAHKSVRQKLADLLLKLSKFHGEAEEKRIKINIKLSRDEMGSMIGTVNETVTRYITEFKEAGFILEKNKFIYILDLQSLTKIAD
jgi:CRP-like cAMP-binding protein